jgi:hypothetical protein
MSKSWIAFAFLPLLAACAGTAPGPQMAEQQCKAVEQDNTDSHIKVKNECTQSGASSSTSHEVGPKLAPQ